MKVIRFLAASALVSSAVATFVGSADAARIPRPFNYDIQASANCGLLSSNSFSLVTETVDGEPISDADPSPNSGLFIGAVDQYSFFAQSSNGGSDSSSDVLCDETTVEVESLNLVTQVTGNSVSFSLFSPAPYERKVLDRIYQVNEFGVPELIGEEIRFQTVANTAPLYAFTIIGFDGSLGGPPGVPEATVGFSPEIQSRLVNSLDLIDFITTFDGDSFGFTDATYISLPNPEIDQIIAGDGDSVSVPEPATAAAALVAGILGLFVKKRKFERS